MKAAFLFENKCPVYDLTCHVIQTIPVEERGEMNTLISTGH